MPVINRDASTTDAPKPKRRNIRTLPANRMEYLLENYPHDIEIREEAIMGVPRWWSEEQVKRAMQAAYNAGRRDEKERRDG